MLLHPRPFFPAREFANIGYMVIHLYTMYKIIYIPNILLNPLPAFQILILKDLFAIFAGFLSGFFKLIIFALVSRGLSNELFMIFGQY